MKFFLGYLATTKLPEGPGQFLWAQQAANMFGPERRVSVWVIWHVLLLLNRIVRKYYSASHRLRGPEN
jgi:hypothetical protein